jgi:hypothetical protein
MSARTLLKFLANLDGNRDEGFVKGLFPYPLSRKGTASSRVVDAVSVDICTYIVILSWLKD